jgi:hypothetical protein
LDALYSGPRALREAMLNIDDKSQMCWHTPAIPATREAEVRIKSSSPPHEKNQGPTSKIK